MESLTEHINVDAGTLSEGNLEDYQAYSDELHLTSQMETDETEEVIIDVEEEIVLGTEEVEIETERLPSPELIVPDIKTKVPPLRPLTIAPKPTKVPVALKPLTGGQLLLLQGQSLSAAPNAGQTIKLLSTEGREFSIANVQLGRPIKPASTVKTIASAGNISVLPQKQMTVKQVVSPGGATKNVVKAISSPTSCNKPSAGQHFVVVQKMSTGGESSSTHVKLVSTGAAQPQFGQTKTISLQQAQEMGLLVNATKAPAAKTATLLVNKTGAATKSFKLVPQASIASAPVKTITLNQIKSPTKILPANKIPIYKRAGAQSILQQGQVIQVATASGQNFGTGGQLHQINIPGKGLQYIKFVPSTTSAPQVTVSNSAVTNTKPNLSLHTTPGGSLVLSELGTGYSNHHKNVKPVVINKPVTVNTQVVMLPYISTTQANSPSPRKVAIPKQTTPKQQQQQQQPQQHQQQHQPISKQSTVPEQKPVYLTTVATTSPVQLTTDSLFTNGIRSRKPCNCTKSQCLKLYCDCFANGEFCYQCKCTCCFNNLENEEFRQRAIRTCLERNPNAFRPKIGKAKDVPGDMPPIRKHTKGCNCKRSGCLKNYCECYEAKIACSSNCKCVGCRNIEDSLERKNLRSVINNGVSILPSNKSPSKLNNVPYAKPKSSTMRQAVSYINDDVIEATCHCLISVADKAAENMTDVEMTARDIIVEFGRCLNEIIECTMNKS